MDYQTKYTRSTVERNSLHSMIINPASAEGFESTLILLHKHLAPTLIFMESVHDKD